MIKQIEEKIAKEITKILQKEELNFDEVQILIAYKNDLKFDEKMKKIIEFTS